MDDPKIYGAPIFKPTLCRAGMHTWVWNGVTHTAHWDLLYNQPLEDIRCTCGLYTWGEWRKAQGAE